MGLGDARLVAHGYTKPHSKNRHSRSLGVDFHQASHPSFFDWTQLVICVARRKENQKHLPAHPRAGTREEAALCRELEAFS